MRYNGFDLSDWLYAEKVKNPPLPPVQITTQSVPGMHGARFVSKKLAARTIIVDVAVVGDTREEYMERVRQIAGTLYEPGVARLSDLPGDTHYYNASLSAWTMEKLMTIGHGSIEFFCADPFGYGLDKVIPLGIDAVITGNVGANGIIRQAVDTAIAEDIVFQTRKGDACIRIFGPFEAGDQIKVDTRKGHVTINGASAMSRVDIRSEWFLCLPGATRIVVSPATLSGGTFTYTERWL